MRRWCPGSSTPMCTAAAAPVFRRPDRDGDGGCPAPAAWHHHAIGGLPGLESPADLLRQVTELAGEAGVIAGIHLEGVCGWPPNCCGAHDPAAPSSDPEPGNYDGRRRRGGTIRMVTLAPKRSGALDAIATLVDANVVRPLATPRRPTPRPGPRSRPGRRWRRICSTRCDRSTTASRVRSSPCWRIRG